MSRSDLKKFDDGFRKNPHSLIIGVDEVGRGALAGPVVAASIVLPPNYSNEEINDSKALTPQKREKLAKELLEVAISYSYGVVEAKIIDEINILNATKEAMKIAISNLDINNKDNLVLVDAIKSLDVKNEVVGIIKGDSKSLSIAAASIIAKVYRDHLMDELDKEFPQYNFKSNKGYGTKEHLDAIREHGPIKDIHRITFKGVSFIPLFEI